MVVTGANGNLGRALLRALAGRASYRVRALVRSERAARQLIGTSTDAEVWQVDPLDEAQLAAATLGFDAVVHLVGILKEGSGRRYRDAHEGSAEALAGAASQSGCGHIVYVSILGADRADPNPCLASKGRAEAILCAGAVPTTVLRLPMVIGEDEPATHALRARARRPVVFLLDGGQRLDQPIDARDVIAAIGTILEHPPAAGSILELAGPEALPYRELLTRAAALWGRTPRAVALPLPLAQLVARWAERWLDDPPLTAAMLDVLARDDAIDPKPACDALGLELTPLAETLSRWVGPPGARSGV